VENRQPTEVQQHVRGEQGTGTMEIRYSPLGEVATGAEPPALGSVRGDSSHGQLVTATTWDGHTVPAEAGATLPSCSVRVIKALDCGSGQYIVKEGVSTACSPFVFVLMHV